MKAWFRHWLMAVVAAVAACCCASCEFHTLDNGQLDGYWQLTDVDTLAGGSTDMVPRRIFWSVQARLLQVTDLTYQLDECILRFDHSDGQFRVYSPYVVDHAGSDVAVTDGRVLHPFGIQSLDETFAVERLDDERMVLRGDVLRLRFRRY